MSDTPETIDAILADFHSFALRAATVDHRDIHPESVLLLCDKIKAAVERERNAHTNDIHDALYKATGIPGNSAAMREALERLASIDLDEDIWDEDGADGRKLHNAVIEARAALSATARNCDVGTAEEQAERHERFCAAHYKADAVDAQCFGCPASDKKETDCEFVWGQLPFAPEEGGAE